MGPSAKLHTLREASLPQFNLSRFSRAASQDLALDGIKKCFPSFASAIRLYFSFCELRGSPFPVTERIMVERIGIFSPGATFSNYVGYIRKAFYFLEAPLLWGAAALGNVIAALKLQGAGKYRFPNFTRGDFVVKILAFESRDSIFAQLCYASFLFALRVPSEALRIRRDFKDDDLAIFAPMNDKALIAFRGTAPALVLRLDRRKNLAHGCILPRPCFCALAQPKAKRLCPVRSIWPAIAARVRQGKLLFPGFYGTNVNTIIKAVLAKLSAPYAEGYSPHGFRRGAAQELKEKGSQRPTVMGVGFWRSLAFRGYVDTTLGVERDVSRLLIETDILADEELEVLTVGNGALRI